MGSTKPSVQTWKLRLASDLQPGGGDNMRDLAGGEGGRCLGAFYARTCDKKGHKEIQRFRRGTLKKNHPETIWV